MNQIRQENSIWRWIKTTTYFVIFLLLLPFIISAFCVVTFYHKLKLFILSKRFRYLEFARSNTIRTLVDTSRNPGILHFLVKVKGQCNLEEIRDAYKRQLLDRKDRNGKFFYPRLKTMLGSCWGQYAFIKNFDEFKIENHIILGPTTYKGKPIDKNNVQKCMSSIVSKYMPCDIPPWQIKIIELSDENAYYLLIRIHHLILDEQKNLKVADMILLDRSKGMEIIHAFPSEMRFLKALPIDNLIKIPGNLLTLYYDIAEAIVSRWNEFVLRHDSLYHHDGVGKQPKQLSDLCSSLTMVCLNTYIEYKHHSQKLLKGSSDPLAHFRYLNGLISEECYKRQISYKVIFNLILKTIHPFNVFMNIVQFTARVIFMLLFLSPFYILRELNAIRRYLFLNHEINLDSFCGFLMNYVPLCIGGIKEIAYFAEIIYNAPRLIVEEIFLSENDDTHYLNTTLCGRKLVSWSETISVEQLNASAKRNKLSYAEILFATISSCLKNYFETLKEEGKTNTTPQTIKFNFRSVPFSYLFGSMFKRNGVLGLNLPVNHSSVSQFVEIRDQIARARHRQGIIYLLSLIQIRFDFLTTVIPSMWLKLLINFLSKKYSISITLALGMNEFELKEYRTCYNSEIEDVIFFRTPQSNNSTNITIQRFRNKVRMNIMCDSNIEMQHCISNSFRNEFYKIPLIRKV